MAYEFKKLSDVEVVESPSDVAHVLIEENGIIKKVIKNAVGETSEVILGKLAAVDAAEEPTENANVLIEENGTLKRVPARSVGGFKTAIITDNIYDLLITGQTDSFPEDQVFTCLNMTYEEACEILDSGEILDTYIKFALDSSSPNIAHGIIFPVHNLQDHIEIEVSMGSEIFALIWTADRIGPELN